MKMHLLFLSPSGGEIILILVLVLLLFGADKIPELARGLGKGIRQIKNATGEIQEEITKNVSKDIKDIKDIKAVKKLKDDLDITKNL